MFYIINYLVSQSYAAYRCFTAGVYRWWLSIWFTSASLRLCVCPSPMEIEPLVPLIRSETDFRYLRANYENAFLGCCSSEMLLSNRRIMWGATNASCIIKIFSNIKSNIKYKKDEVYQFKSIYPKYYHFNI